MALSSQDRISLSKQIVYSVAQFLASKLAQTNIQSAATTAGNLDSANKSLFDTQNTSVNNYQGELSYLTGLNYTPVTETDMTNSAQRVAGNYFYPSGWTLTVPKATTTGQGLPTSSASHGAESTQITTVNTQIAAINTIFLTLGPSSALSPLKTALATLSTDLTTYNSFLSTEQGAIITSDPYHASDATAAVSNITTIQTAITTFQTAISTVLTAMTGFVLYPAPSDPGYATFVAALTDFQTAMSTFQTALGTSTSSTGSRYAFTSTRTGQLQGYLGSLSQDGSGVVTSGVTSNGSYYARWQLIQARLNLMTGSLTQQQGLSKSAGFQSSTQSSISSNLNTWFNALVASQFTADSNGTTIINVNAANYYANNITGVTPPVNTPTNWFANGDTVYVAADNQAEITTTISSIFSSSGGGQQITLADPIPITYLKTQYARLYKVVS